MSSTNPYAPPAAHVDDVASTEAASVPTLWNPGAAANWSLLFSPIFGALLHMKNWQALGDPARALRSRNWAIGSTAVYLATNAFAVLAPQSRLNAWSRMLALALLIAWYFIDGKSQHTLVREKFGKAYPRRGWGRPLLMALGVWVGLVLVVGVLGFIVALVRGRGAGSASVF